MGCYNHYSGLLNVLCYEVWARAKSCLLLFKASQNRLSVFGRNVDLCGQTAWIRKGRGVTRSLIRIQTVWIYDLLPKPRRDSSSESSLLSRRFELKSHIGLLFVLYKFVKRSLAITFLFLVIPCYFELKLICDVIYEKGPYCVTNIIGPDRTPRMMRGVWPGPTILVAYEHLKETFFSLPAR